MNYTDFIGAVAEHARIPSAEAERITRATLETLTDRVTAGQANGLAEQLPAELRQHLHKTTTGNDAQFAESFGLDQFVRRVISRAGMNEAMANDGTRAVLATIGEAVSSEELDRFISQMPKEFREIIQTRARAGAPQSRR
ncbi:MAG TPA: DUF2267 domain-containing protein [Micromonosporaceae bacterium]|nr:DUF2267 domain-containing protein [Micromonosporaceae bacterium]